MTENPTNVSKVLTLSGIIYFGLYDDSFYHSNVPENVQSADLESAKVSCWSSINRGVKLKAWVPGLAQQTL